jgi:signal transduction histidine kinase
LVTADDRSLYLRIRDNGRGGADLRHGTGLVGLKDRAEALGGHLQLDSPPGVGTTLAIELPIQPSGPDLPPEPG